jgi:hypothetical protein
MIETVIWASSNTEASKKGHSITHLVWFEIAFSAARTSVMLLFSLPYVFIRIDWLFPKML